MQFTPHSELGINHVFQPRNTEKPVLFKSDIAKHPDHFRTRNLHQAALILTKTSICSRHRELAAVCCPVQRKASWEFHTQPVTVLEKLRMLLSQFVFPK